MGLDISQFKKQVIRPTLRALDLETNAAVELLLGTAIQESRLVYLKQLGRGPAVGVYQMEPATHDDIWDNYLAYKTELAELVRGFSLFGGSQAGEMAGNLYYATAMARVHYLRVPKPLPSADDVEGMAAYWKEHYNTYLGAGTEEEFEEHYREATFGL